MNAPFLIRAFDPAADWPMIADWHDAHGTTAPPLSILPKLGVVVFEDGGESAAALWLYMDNSVGVCFPEHAVTRPGLSMFAAKTALLVALDFFRQRAAELDYGAMIVNTPAAMARVLERTGIFERAGGQKVTMIGLTKEVSNGN
jgi:hypothetical protein